MTNTIAQMPADRCQPHGFTDCCNVVIPTLADSECLNYSGGCGGAVEYRMPLSGTGKSYPRCDMHWSERLDLDAQISERYPTHAPSDFDPSYAGECWDEDDY